MYAPVFYVCFEMWAFVFQPGSVTLRPSMSFSLFSRMFYDEELEDSERFYKSQPLGLQLCYALYNLLVAHSEMVCYLVIILNHMISASMVTLVLPILIFLWAMLSVPRPSKRFWMTAIVYTEVSAFLVQNSLQICRLKAFCSQILDSSSLLKIQ